MVLASMWHHLFPLQTSEENKRENTNTENYFVEKTNLFNSSKEFFHSVKKTDLVTFRNFLILILSVKVLFNKKFLCD